MRRVTLRNLGFELLAVAVPVTVVTVAAVLSDATRQANSFVKVGLLLALALIASAPFRPSFFALSSTGSEPTKRNGPS